MALRCRRRRVSYRLVPGIRNDKFKNGIATYIYFVKLFKDHPRQPEVYFELAQLLNERANNNTKSRQNLAAIVKKYPDHELVPQVRDYLATVA